jgi:carboxymethylenebutenolidase
MCFDHDSRPPIAPIEGGALDSGELTLRSADGTDFTAFGALAADPLGVGMIVLPDVRGLHPYYEDLALRFAEHGVDAVAIDYFGRTAGLGRRGPTFDHQPHVMQLTWAGLAADIRAAAAHLRSAEGGGVKALSTMGFCIGGRIAFLTATLDIDPAGVVGFYGWPTGPHRSGLPAPADVAGQMHGKVLAIFGGADEGIGEHVRDEFEASLRAASVDHRMITYPGAPHSFFDRKADEFAATSDKAWHEVLTFIGAREASSV